MIFDLIRIVMLSLIRRLSVLFYLFTGTFIFSGCSDRFSPESDEEYIGNYEDRLIELAKRVENLPRYADPSKFIKVYEEILPILKSTRDTSIATASIRNQFIQMSSDNGMYRQALFQSKLALQANNIENYNDSIVNNLIIYGKLAFLYEKAGCTDSIFITCQKAINDVINHPDPLWLSSALNNYGFYLHRYGKNDLAMNNYLLADSILEVQHILSDAMYNFRGSIKDNMAEIYEEKGEYLKAAKIYSTNFFERYRNKKTARSLVEAGISLANVEILLSHYDHADEIIKHLELILDTAKYPDIMKSKIAFLQLKTKYFEGIGDIESGFKSSQKLIFYKDSLYYLDENLMEKTMNSLIDYTSAQFAAALKKEKETRNLYEQRSQLRLQMVIFAILFAAVALLLVIMFQRQKFKLLETDKLLSREKLKRQEQKQQLLRLQLENKQKDLTDMAISLHHKQEWAKELNKQIHKINAERGYKRSREFKKLQDEIRSNVFVDKKLELLQQNIDTLSHEFYHRLNERFPVLTKSDIKLCSYIKLHMNNSQIAQLENIEPSSVKVSRYRLKKKLNLESSQDLDTFIQKFNSLE